MYKPFEPHFLSTEETLTIKEQSGTIYQIAMQYFSDSAWQSVETQQTQISKVKEIPQGVVLVELPHLQARKRQTKGTLAQATASRGQDACSCLSCKTDQLVRYPSLS